MDEFAIQKGHRYATVVVDVERKRVLLVGRGRSRAEVRPFFELLGPQRCAQVQAAAMDMNTAHDPQVRQPFPNARVLPHPFHVIAKSASKESSPVRVAAANTLPDRTDVRQYKRVTGTIVPGGRR